MSPAVQSPLHLRAAAATAPNRYLKVSANTAGSTSDRTSACNRHWPGTCCVHQHRSFAGNSLMQVRDLEARLLAEREEKGRLMDEKQALGARLAKLRDAGTVGGGGVGCFAAGCPDPGLLACPA
jgi:hypothetical protein